MATDYVFALVPTLKQTSILLHVPLNENLLLKAENTDFTKDFIRKTMRGLYISQCSDVMPQTAVRYLPSSLFSAVGLCVF